MSKIKLITRNAHYARLTQTDDGKVAYNEPVSIPSLLELTFDYKRPLNDAHADCVYLDDHREGYGCMHMHHIPEAFYDDVMNGEDFALLYEFCGAPNRYALYRCHVLDVADYGGDRRMVCLNIKFSCLPNGLIRSYASKKSSAYDRWYDEVYIPEEDEND